MEHGLDVFIVVLFGIRIRRKARKSKFSNGVYLKNKPKNRIHCQDCRVFYKQVAIARKKLAFATDFPPQKGTKFNDIQNKTKANFQLQTE